MRAASRIDRGDVDVALPQVASDGRAGDARSARSSDPGAGLGGSAPAVSVAVGRCRLARAHEGARIGRRPTPACRFRSAVAQRLPDEAKAAAAVVPGDAAAADRPARAGRVVVAQILADAGRLAHRDAERRQSLRLTDARRFQELRRVDRAALTTTSRVARASTILPPTA